MSITENPPWRASRRLFEGLVEANKKMLGVDEKEEEKWSYERTVDSIDEISVGDEVKFTKEIDDEDILQFAEASGDVNAVHLDDSIAEKSRFGERIVHGTLVSGLISSALARLPGLVIYISKELKYLKPAYPGERLTAVCKVEEEIGGGRYRLSTKIYNEEEEVLVDGESTVLIDKEPDWP